MLERFALEKSAIRNPLFRPAGFSFRRFLRYGPARTPGGLDAVPPFASAARPSGCGGAQEAAAPTLRESLADLTPTAH